MTRDWVYTDDPVDGWLNLGFSYKGWSVNTQWTGAWNVSRMLDGVFRMPFYNKTSNTMGGTPEVCGGEQLGQPIIHPRVRVSTRIMGAGTQLRHFYPL